MWELIKCEIIGAISDCAKWAAKRDKLHLNKLFDRLAEIQSEMVHNPTTDNFNNIAQAETEINEIVEKKTKSAIFRTKMHWHTQGERSSAYYFS